MVDFFKPELSSTEQITDEVTKQEMNMYLTGANHDCIFETSEQREEPSKVYI
jgi:hypothetical protein